MTLIQLEYLVALDTYRNFVVAAEKCFVTQPTLSMQVQKLEENLGVKLLDRSRQPVVPTEIGEQVIAQARKVLAEQSKIRELIASHKDEIRGELKIGVIPTIAPFLLPGVIKTMSSKYPALQLKIWEFTTDEITRRLKNGLLDCGVLSTPLADQQLKEIPLFYENFVVYLSQNSELARKKKLDPQDIYTEEIWLLNEGHCMRNQVINICGKSKGVGGTIKGFEYNTGSVETLKRMVDLNNGLTILPELSLKDLNENEFAQVRYFRSPEPAREISIVTHRNFLKKSAITAFQNEILLLIPASMLSSTKKEVMEIFS